MAKIEWSKIADNNLSQIYNYIYKDSIYYAVKTINKMVELTDNLGVFQYMGRKVPEYDKNNIRELIYKSYRIIYEIQFNNILIRRIWHSARNLPKQLIS